MAAKAYRRLHFQPHHHKIMLNFWDSSPLARFIQNQLNAFLFFIALLLHY